MNGKFLRGSEWRKWDLHVHTPASDGTGTPEEIVAKAIEEKLAVIAITDHHSVAYIDKVKNAARGKPLTVLSGIEFRSEYGSKSVHFIAYFPERHENTVLDSCSLQDLILSPLGVSRTTIIAKGKGADSSLNDDEAFKKGMFLVQVDFKQAANLVHDYGGLISVHNGDKTNGLETEVKHFGSAPKNAHSLYDSLGTHKEELLKKYIDICDVGNSDDSTFYLKTFNKPSIMASDAHNVMDIGSKFTWIKADPTFDGLKQILFEPEERVKIQEAKPEEKAAYQVIDSVSISEDGFWNQTIPLNPNLVTIIGGRSSGKSTLLSCIAEKIGYTQQYDDSMYSESEKEFINEHQCSIAVAWADNGGPQDRKVDFFRQNYMINLQSKQEELDILIKQILSETDKAKFLQQYAQLIHNTQAEIMEKMASLFFQRDQLEMLDSSIKEKGGLEGHHRAVEVLSQQLDEQKKHCSGLTEEERGQFDYLRKAIDECEKNIFILTRDKEAIESLIYKEEKEVVSVLDTSPFSIDIGKSLLEKHSEIWHKSHDAWLSFLRSIDAEIREQIEKEKHNLEEYMRPDIYKKGVDDLNANSILKDLENRIAIEKNKCAEVDILAQKRQKLQDENQQLIDTIARKHVQYQNAAQQLATDVACTIENLSIKGILRVKKEMLKSKLEGQITRKTKSQHDLVEAMIKHDSFGYEQLKDFMIKVMKREIAYNQDVNEQYLVSDFLSSNWFNVNYDIVYQNDTFVEMSPGKRAFVILRLLLEFGNNECPILIDQPEDSLDNRAIFTELVQYLRTKKKKRQIILVTHNPNVVVGADAEQVIIANQNGIRNVNVDGVKFSYVSGSLENSSPLNKSCPTVLEAQGVREHVCEILEGGEDAFKKRENKYGFPHAH